MGSKQWIGAIELGFVLETLLGITSKVISIRSGDEIDSRAPEIAHHFDTQVDPLLSLAQHPKFMPFRMGSSRCQT